MLMRIGMTVGALVAVSLVVGCQKTVDPRTGEGNIQLSVPMTQRHGDRLEQRWEECVRFRSVSACERRLPGARPARRSAPAAPEAADSEGAPAAASPPAEQAPAEQAPAASQ
ncbi:hypothetical protein DF3PA_230017 [Candidatus Defluviicoccus seviourii]|uniref:Lipoprotein n=2 Tax=root TaxID=1 RepID=A0A564WDH3_9PROT|nr:hypothetical protein DF3PB_810004 [uncultured Defluviicoccus sp.]VUX46515.1 hypothetical protein DF3PA_230017 [Candidatus Defluviicoccus seviourii]